MTRVTGKMDVSGGGGKRPTAQISELCLTSNQFYQEPRCASVSTFSRIVQKVTLLVTGKMALTGKTGFRKHEARDVGPRAHRVPAARAAEAGCACASSGRSGRGGLGEV